MDRINQIYTKMIPGVWYRPSDLVCDDIDSACARRVLRTLARGGVVDVENDSERGRKNLYITKQRQLL